MAIDNKLLPGTYVTLTTVPTILLVQSLSTAAYVGLFRRGPAFVPTLVDKTLLDLTYGTADQEYYTKYAADNYLLNNQSVVISRIMHNEPFTFLTSSLATITNNGTSSITIAATKGSKITACTVTSSNIAVAYSSSVGTGSITGSAIPTAVNYIGKLIGYNPKSTGTLYVLKSFLKYLVTNSSSLSLTASVNNTVTNVVSSSINFAAAKTPYIISQCMSATTASISEYKLLFRFVHLSDGNISNKLIKITISDIKLQDLTAGIEWTSFTVQVRDFNDTDERPIVLLRFVDVNLNPEDDNYIARVIGNKYYQFIDSGSLSDFSKAKTAQLKQYGLYNNNSNYIRVLMSSAVSNGLISSDIKPYGFKNLYKPINNCPDISLVTSSLIITDLYDNKKCYGFDFNSTDNVNYCNYYHSGYSTSSFFSVSKDISSVLQIATATDIKFSIPFQGGLEGISPRLTLNNLLNVTANNFIGLDFSALNKNGNILLQAALSLLSNKLSVNILSVTYPGLTLQLHKDACYLIDQMCKDRGDCQPYFDTSIKGKFIDSTFNFDNVFNSEYASNYYPWLKVKLGKSFIWLPPTVCIQTPISYTDVNYSKYDSIAGPKRGLMSKVVSTEFDLNATQRGFLQSKRINPISFFQDGVATLWGNLTMLVTKPNEKVATSRVNVRRALCQIKKLVAENARKILFDTYSTNMVKTFTTLCRPYFEVKLLTEKISSYEIVDKTTNELLAQNAISINIPIKFNPTVLKIFINVESSNSTITVNLS